MIGMTAAAVLSMNVMFSTTAYAGTWNQDETGWRRQEDDGSYPVSQWKWIDGNRDRGHSDPGGLVPVNQLAIYILES